jgi:hypothetical protein
VCVHLTECLKRGLAMRFPWILTLALVAATIPAGAQQKNNKYVVKPSHEQKSKAAPALKAPSQHASGSTDLQKIEQQTAKSAASRNSSGRAHVAAVKTQREKANPPIHFSSGTGGHGVEGSANSSKSRVRTKGHH